MAPDLTANYSPSNKVPDALDASGLDDDFSADSKGDFDMSETPDAVGLPHAGAVDDTPRQARMPAEYAGERLDKALARLFPQYSRSRLQAWLDEGRVTVDGEVAKPKQSALADTDVEVTPAVAPEMLAFQAEPIALPIVAEARSYVVVDKPAGLVVHPAVGNWSGTLLNGLLHRYGDAALALPRAGIVHRLDKDTSGLMVVARTVEAQTDLIRQLQARTVHRRYLALVWGRAGHGTVDAPLGRDPRDRVKIAVVPGAAGKPAVTHYRAIAHGELDGKPVSAVICDLETGRTHQIRVHMAHINHRLLGDPLYGRIKGQHANQALPGGFARQALHAWQLGFRDPETDDDVEFRAALPADIVALAQACGFDQELDLDLFSRQ
ncbi:RluA family pseudouridine synthase [Pararobbsia silviterrae]|uniref:Pseudouridine synthase n=1 Tax=Pararobbsia silviterrae TaxID=1792498 RepID=A0A494XZZ2_9BURK|nr:RluA family pseudouridine synthase [Pararobbsia silviterrae]RKP54619.1 RluA family pseudouridine synthase [Pararobbsia silviterrae]